MHFFFPAKNVRKSQKKSRGEETSSPFLTAQAQLSLWTLNLQNPSLIRLGGGNHWGDCVQRKRASIAKPQPATLFYCCIWSGHFGNCCLNSLCTPCPMNEKPLSDRHLVRGEMIYDPAAWWCAGQLSHFERTVVGSACKESASVDESYFLYIQTVTLLALWCKCCIEETPGELLNSASE